MVELKIDPEFRDKIPAMPQEDFDGLRADIIRDGYVRDPLVVWEEENILLDGHHRWKVIQENPGLLGDKFNVDYKSFPDRWAAIAWICANQLHKHNMTELQRLKLIQEEYEARQKTSGGQIGNKNAEKRVGKIPQVVFTDLVTGEEKPLPPPKNPGKEPTTRNIIAQEHGISPDGVRSAVEIGRGIDKAAKVDPEFKREVLSGEIKAKKSDLAALRKLETDEEVKAAVEEIRKPKPVRKPSEHIQPVKAKQHSGWTEKDRELAERIRQNIENENREVIYTIENLVDEVRRNADNYISSLKQTFVVRSTLLVGENRTKAAESVDYVIKEITKIKELLA